MSKEDLIEIKCLLFSIGTAVGKLREVIDKSFIDQESERERCAKIAENYQDQESSKQANFFAEVVGKDIAKLIRNGK